MENEDHVRANKIYHRINKRDARQIRQPQRRMPLAKQADVSEILNDIEESDSPWSSPVVLVRKRMGNSVTAWATGN
jgi:hypothetical protein